MFAVVARRAGEHWRLTDDEALALGEATLNLYDALPIPELQSALAKALTVYVATVSEVVGTKITEGALASRAAVYRAQGMTQEDAERKVVDEMMATLAAQMSGFPADGSVPYSPAG